VLKICFKTLDTKTNKSCNMRELQAGIRSQLAATSLQKPWSLVVFKWKIYWKFSGMTGHLNHKELFMAG
jgi:hypothetical protein